MITTFLQSGDQRLVLADTAGISVQVVVMVSTLGSIACALAALLYAGSVNCDVRDNSHLVVRVGIDIPESLQ
ncbi:hypothetical protein [Microbulbifer spongiae]|uniref:Uncharacterized protein n=1 Tax=Microbulbifer spongiae TaxID=2944933 RepID=A0ABY9E806_9GAMM|nr:hypothetical protein [Microbulbifer sp. MI-G]WKD49133.1 hypothetical protein M8T91_14705 [Microbulbifer sp. MI-G]